MSRAPVRTSYETICKKKPTVSDVHARKYGTLGWNHMTRGRIPQIHRLATVRRIVFHWVERLRRYYIRWNEICRQSVLPRPLPAARDNFFNLKILVLAAHVVYVRYTHQVPISGNVVTKDTGHDKYRRDWTNKTKQNTRTHNTEIISHLHITRINVKTGWRNLDFKHASDDCPCIASDTGCVQLK